MCCTAHTGAEEGRVLESARVDTTPGAAVVTDDAPELSLGADRFAGLERNLVSGETGLAEDFKNTTSLSDCSAIRQLRPVTSQAHGEKAEDCKLSGKVIH